MPGRAAQAVMDVMLAGERLASLHTLVRITTEHRKTFPKNQLAERNDPLYTACEIERSGPHWLELWNTHEPCGWPVLRQFDLSTKAGH
jgi:hypothetical protein